MAFGYNDRREVVLARQFDGASDQDPEVLPRKREYAFDPIGNRLTRAEGGGSPVSYQANELNQYETVGATALAYDLDGNLTGAGSRSYSWDGENRLIRFEEISGPEGIRVDYVYDYRGRRVAAMPAFLFQEGGDWQTEPMSPTIYVWDDWNLLLRARRGHVSTIKSPKGSCL